MSAVFLKLLNMSITASWLILAVFAARLLLKKAPRWIVCLLWGFVALRLLCPFSLKSAFSLVPSAETIPADIAETDYLKVHTGFTAVNTAINPVIQKVFNPMRFTHTNRLPFWLNAAAFLWGLTFAAMILYALYSFGRLRKRVSASLPVRDRVFACDTVQSPFILGILRPRIYVPSSMQGAALDAVLRHEAAHLQRRDHWWKPLGYFLLAVYWFNPLCWIAYLLLCRDIETACDQKVIRSLNRNGIADYSQALLECSLPRRQVTACPLAFGEVGVKQRVKNVLNYKKPALWIVLIALLLCAGIALCLLTNPFGNRISSELPALKWFDLDHDPESDWQGVSEIRIDAFPGTVFCCDHNSITAADAQETVTLYEKTVSAAYFCDLTGDGAPELCWVGTVGSTYAHPRGRIYVYDYRRRVSYQAMPASDGLRSEYAYTINSYSLNLQNGALIAECRDVFDNFDPSTYFVAYLTLDDEDRIRIMTDP